MTYHELLTICGLSLWLLWVFFGIGQAILSLLRIKQRQELFWSGIAVLFGIGVFGYSILILGLAKLITTTGITILLIIITVLLFRSTLTSARHLANAIYQSWLTYRRDRIVTLLLLVIIFLLGVHFIAAFAPPIGRDEIGYHLPEALNVLSQKQVIFPLGGHLFYGNIPVLMEIIYAGAIALGGYTLTHVIHYMIFLAFLWTVGAILTRLYSPRTGLLAIVLLFLNSALARNSITAFIDTAVIGYELSALLLFFYWLVKSVTPALWTSAGLLGLALSLKYSPAFTAGFIGIIFIYILLAHLKNARSTLIKIFYYSLITLIVCGFWYLKNFVHYTNPFYPLYFGHKGYSETDYVSLITAIQDFVVPRTWQNFINIPERLFLSTSNLPVFFAFYISPLGLVIKKNRIFMIGLIVYLLSYSAYWFFFATHQVRFLTPAIAIATIAMAIALTQFRRTLLTGLIVIIIGVMLWINHSVKPILSIQSINNYWQETIKFDFLAYSLGRQTKGQFLAGQFGCQVEVLQYLEQNHLKGSVIDNWSVWHDPSVSFYAQKNPVIVGPLDVPINQLPDIIATYGFRYIYYKDTTKKQFFLDTDPAVVNYRNKRITQETFLLDQSHQIYEQDGCRLFAIDLPLKL